MNQSKFAELCCVSRMAISKAIKRGTVIKAGKLGIDSDHPVNLDYQQSQNNSRTRRDPNGNKPGPKKGAPKSKPTKKAQVKQNPDASSKVIGIPEEYDSDLPVEYFDIDGDIGGISRSDADRLKVIEYIRMAKIKREKLRNELVERKWVTRIFNKVYQVDTGEFRTLGDKLAPDVTAICGINDTKIEHKVNERIDEEVFKVLNHIKRILNDALKKIEAGEIDGIN